MELEDLRLRDEGGYIYEEEEADTGVTHVD